MIDIKEAQKQDLSIIANFQVLMALETENLQLDLEIVKRGVKKFFDEPFMGKYFLAKDGDKTVGCVLIQYEWSDWRNSKVIWLHSVYIVPEYRKQGIFSKIYGHIKEIVERNEDYAGIRLFVDKTNINAQNVYKRQGMTSEHYELFEWLK